MKNQAKASTRDPSQSASYFKKVAASEKKIVERAQKKESLGSLIPGPNSGIRAGLALYSAGEPVEECLSWLDKAVSLKLRFLEFQGYRFVGYATFTLDLELFPAGALVGRAAELIAAYRRCEFQKPKPPAFDALMNALCAVLTDEPLSQKDSTIKDPKAAKAWQGLSSLLAATAKKNTEVFDITLGEYLTSYWVKEVRAAGSSEYVGKWSLLAAGLCKKIGRIPDLAEPPKQYLPVDLIRFS